MIKNIKIILAGILIIGIVLISGCIKEIDENHLNNKTDIENNSLEDFCGFSTYGSCSSDSECSAGGCSGQVCQSKNEEPVITTCEFRDCYNAKKYNLKCRCVENKCQWSK